MFSTSATCTQCLCVFARLNRSDVPALKCTKCDRRQIINKHKLLNMSLRRLFRSRPCQTPTVRANVLSVAERIEEECTPHYSPKHFYPMRLYQVLNDRYQVSAKLGWGTSSTVWLARDLDQYVRNLIIYQYRVLQSNKTVGAGSQPGMLQSKSMRTITRQKNARRKSYLSQSI